jgi:hypothetical protein
MKVCPLCGGAGVITFNAEEKHTSRWGYPVSVCGGREKASRQLRAAEAGSGPTSRKRVTHAQGAGIMSRRADQGFAGKEPMTHANPAILGLQ